jgi:hypothetical protein
MPLADIILDGGMSRVKYEMIDAREAPPKPSGPSSKRAELFMRIVDDLSWGRVAKIQLEGTETVRGTKTSLSRVAKRMGKPITSWHADNTVYVELGQGAPRRRGRPPKTAS